MRSNTIVVCSKPTQVIQVMGFLRECGAVGCRLFVIAEGFAAVEAFKESTQDYLREVFADVSFVDSRESLAGVLADLEIDFLLVECDRAESYLFYRRFCKNRLTVFEEGFGTYCGGPDRSFLHLRWAKWQFLKLCYGAGMFFGNSRITTRILVNDRSLYLALNRVESKKEVVEKKTFLRELVTLSGYVDLAALSLYSGKRIVLVLGTKGAALDGGSWREREPDADHILLKAHPHEVSQCGDVGGGCEMLSLANWIPGELLILALSSICQTTVVYHYSSSVALYCRTLPNVTFRNLGYNDRYDKVMAAASRMNCDFDARGARQILENQRLDRL